MNRRSLGGVLPDGTAMDALADILPGNSVGLEAPLEREFEQRLADCPTLAFRVALGVLRNPAEAEDVAQDALVRAYRNFHRLRDRERFRAWLVRTAWRLALDRVRAAGRRERRERAALDPPPTATAEDLAASREFERHLAAAIDALPEKLRLVVILAAIEGHDTCEVAASEPDVLVPQGEWEAIARLAVAVERGRVNGAEIVAAVKKSRAELEVTPLHIAPLETAQPSDDQESVAETDNF